MTKGIGNGMSHWDTSDCVVKADKHHAMGGIYVGSCLLGHRSKEFALCGAHAFIGTGLIWECNECAKDGEHPPGGTVVLHFVRMAEAVLVGDEVAYAGIVGDKVVQVGDTITFPRPTVSDV